jgi:peptide/nickel transport system substrate-binding protein
LVLNRRRHGCQEIDSCYQNRYSQSKFFVRNHFVTMPKPDRCCLAVLLIALLSGCRFSSPATVPPGYVAIGIDSNPTRLDPRFATDANSVRIGALIYNSLLRPDANSRLQGDLAESWAMADNKTYIFNLHRGVKFHDGRPLMARDVKSTYEFILNPQNRSPRRGPLTLIRSIDELGPYRIRFRLAAPFAPFLEHCTIGIVPEGSPGVAPAGTSIPPPGSGPFILDSMDPGNSIVLRANRSYWDGSPSVSGLVFKIIPDAMVRVLEFKKGTLHLLQNDIEPDMLPWIRRNTDAVVEMQQSTTFQYIGINLTHPILRHQKVRQALALAIDRDAIIHHLLKYQATPATGLLSPLHWAYADNVRHWRYDPETAKRLLDEAGFPDPDADGPRPRFTLSFKTTNVDLRRRIAEAFKDQLHKVGIELEVRPYEWGTFYSDIKKGNFNLFSLAWVGIRDPDFYYNLFHSAAVPPDGDNRGRYRNPEVDQLLEQGRRSTHIEERKLIYRRIQIILARDLPYIPLWWVKNVVIRTPALRGFIPYPDGDLISLKRVSLRAPAPTT